MLAAPTVSAFRSPASVTGSVNGLNLFPLALRSESLERQEGNVVLLFPLFSGEPLQLGQKRIDQPGTLCVRTDELLYSWETEHLVVLVVGFRQPVAVEQYVLPGLEGDVFLFVGHARHQAQGHAGSPEFADTAGVAHEGRVVSGIGVLQ